MKAQCKKKKEKKLVVQQPPERVWIILGIRLVGWEPRHFLSDLIVFALFSFVGAQTSSKTDPWGACKLNLWHLRMASKSRRQLGEMVTLVLNPWHVFVSPRSPSPPFHFSLFHYITLVTHGTPRSSRWSYNKRTSEEMHNDVTDLER